MSQNTSEVMDRIEAIGFLPVIKLEHPERDAVKLAAALIDGGIPTAEVTFRAKGAERAIKLMREAYPKMLVGAGTVITMEQAKAAVEAGAQFIVSPGLDEEIVRYALDQDIAVFPGAVTPTEIQAALKLGLSVVKFFPAKQYGGLKTIQALSAPFASVRFVPTGGVNLNNLADFAAEPCIVACGGSYMISDAMLDREQWDKISDISRQTRECIDAARQAQSEAEDS